jgi:hypothetical protein
MVSQLTANQFSEFSFRRGWRIELLNTMLILFKQRSYEIPTRDFQCDVTILYEVLFVHLRMLFELRMLYNVE